MTQLHPDCEDAVKDAARLCESLGHMVEEFVTEQLSHPAEKVLGYSGADVG